MRFIVFLLGLIASQSAFAAVPRTQIGGKVVHPSGVVPTNCSVNLKVNAPFTINDDTLGSLERHLVTAPQAGVTIPITDPNNVNIYVIPNSGSGQDPSGTVYNVKFITNLGNFDQIWLVPTSAVSLRISDVVVPTAIAPSSAYVPQQGGTFAGTVTFPEVVLSPLAPPTSPVTGSLIYDVNDNRFEYWNGTQWVAWGSGGGTVVHDASLSGDGTSGTPLAVAPAGVDHNALANVASGDVHTQYLPRSGVRPMTGNLDFDLFQALDLVLEKLALDTSPVTARFWYNTNTETPWFSRGWEPVNVMDLAEHTGTISRSSVDNFAHASTHAPGGSDPIAYLPSSNTTLTDNIDFNGYEARTFVFENLAFDPVLPEAGRAWFNSGSNLWKYSNGGSIIDPLARTHHSGTQLRATISDFAHKSTHLPGAGADDLSDTYVLKNGAIFTGNVTFRYNQLIQTVMEKLAVNPAPGNEGRIFWNTALKRFQQDDGTSITDLGVSGGSVVTDGTSTQGTGIAGSPIAVIPGGVNHNALANLTTGDPHTQYVLAAGTRALTGNWNLGDTYRISSSNPTQDQELTPKKYVEDNFLSKVGGTVTGNTTFSGYNLINFTVDPVAADPTDNVTARMWFNTTTNLMKWYNGIAIIDPLARANHSGTQLKSTISDFAHASTHAVGQPDSLATYFLAIGGGTMTGNINMGLNQITNMKLEVLGTNPAAGNAGRVIYNSTLGKMQLDNGTTFGDLASASAFTFKDDYGSGSPATTLNIIGAHSTVASNTANVTIDSLIGDGTNPIITKADQGVSLRTTGGTEGRLTRIMQVQSTGTTPIRASIANDTAQDIIIGANTTHHFRLTVTARAYTGTDDDKSAGYIIDILIANTSGTSTVIGSALKTVLGEEVAGWDVSAEVVDSVQDELAVWCTGSTGTDVDWRIVVEETIIP